MFQIALIEPGYALPLGSPSSTGEVNFWNLGDRGPATLSRRRRIGSKPHGLGDGEKKSIMPGVISIIASAALIGGILLAVRKV